MSHTQNPPCAGCGGPHPFDTSVASVLWNRVVRGQGAEDYLCLTCIVRLFAKAGESLDAQLWGGGFHGTHISMSINGSMSTAIRELEDENNRLRVELRAASVPPTPREP